MYSMYCIIRIWSYGCVYSQSGHFYLYLQKGKKSVNNFDSEFTSEKCELSLVDETVIANIDEELFRGFSFTNPDLYIAS